METDIIFQDMFERYNLPTGLLPTNFLGAKFATYGHLFVAPRAINFLRDFGTIEKCC